MGVACWRMGYFVDGQGVEVGAEDLILDGRTRCCVRLDDVGTGLDESVGINMNGRRSRYQIR
jgi:hypothetical protein